MRIARLRKGDAETYGMVSDGRVATKDDITYLTGVPIPHGIKDFLFDGWLDEIRGKIGGLPYAHDISEFEVLAPIPSPGKIICLAFNYADHAAEQGARIPGDPVMVIKPRTALCGTDASITCPGFVRMLDYEIELALVINGTCKDVATADAMGCVFGYMVFNDVSARDIQRKDGQFTRAKGFDTFAPCGPWITTRDEIPDPHGLRLVTRVNGETRQDSSTGRMSLKVPEIVSKISSVMTLERGDIISTGTPAGVAMNNPGVAFLGNGDRIEMEIEGLGTLRNTVEMV